MTTPVDERRCDKIFDAGSWHLPCLQLLLLIMDQLSFDPFVTSFRPMMVETCDGNHCYVIHLLFVSWKAIFSSFWAAAFRRENITLKVARVIENR